MFETGIEKPAAFFVRGKIFWAVFDGVASEIETNSGNFGQKMSDLIRSVKQHPDETTTILRLELKRPIGVAVTKDGAAWNIIFSESFDIAGKRLLVGNDGRLSAFGFDRVISVSDPLVGDELGIGLSSRDDNGSMGATLVDMEILPSLQGLV